MKHLVDSYGRRIRKLRLSLTDKCNLRCHYCMPVDTLFMENNRLLSSEEYGEIVEELCDYGLEEVRLTGGEPLMRSSFEQITARLALLPLKKIGMTTNAVFLERHLDHLMDHRVHYLNISLDSLDPDSFLKITRGGILSRVLKNIRLATQQNFYVKINVVAMRGINDREIFDFIEFSKNYDVEVRFLELMRIGVACGIQKNQFISADEMIAMIRTRYDLVSDTAKLDSTSFNFKTSCGARIGFIASESKAFCGRCSRWRLSADGMLRACLMKDDGLSIRGTSRLERAVIYQKMLGMKPGLRPVEVSHQMNTIGG